MNKHDPTAGKRLSQLVSDEQLIVWYLHEHLTLAGISLKTGVSRTSINGRLKKLGVSAYDGEHVRRACTHCGTIVERTRCTSRGRKKVFCNQACYAAHLHNPVFIGSRYGLLIARKVVGAFFKLQSRNVVHHWDSNETNNTPRNLAVFVHSAAHMAHHREGSLDGLLWNGRKLSALDLLWFQSAYPRLSRLVPELTSRSAHSWKQYIDDQVNALDPDKL